VIGRWHRGTSDRRYDGAFRSFVHDHRFRSELGGTTMFDVCRFAVPFWPVGWQAERLAVGAYLRRYLEGREAVIRQTAESEEWRSYVPAA